MSILDFLTACDALKQIPRTGWLLQGVAPSAAEDVAGHSYSTAIVAYFLAQLSGEKLDITRLLVMALLHDLPESEIGDIPHSSSTDLKEFYKAKREAENKVMVKLLAKLPSNLRIQLSNIWKDFASGVSREAKLVEAADRLATAIHILHLKKAGYQKDNFTTFLNHAKKVVESLKIPSANLLVKDLFRSIRF